jgi:hypothetical protein
MSSPTVGNNPFPTAIQQQYSTIPKSQDSSAKNWILVADGDMFYFFVNPSTQASYSYFGFAFGYSKSKMTLDDTFGCLIISSSSSSSAFTGGFKTSMLNSLASFCGYIARAFTQIGGSVPFSLFGSGNAAGFGNSIEPFPSPIDNSLNVSPVYTYQGGTRGVMQGILQPLHNKPLGHGSYYKGLVEFPNQTLLSIGLADSSGALSGELHVIVEGYW